MHLFYFYSFKSTNGPQGEKTCLQGFANNTGPDQPAHPRSLISAFVICFLKSIICKLATCDISIFKLVFVAEETGLKLATTKTVFLNVWLLVHHQQYTTTLCNRYIQSKLINSKSLILEILHVFQIVSCLNHM